MIHVENLKYTYPQSHTEAVKGVDFQISKGEIFGFLGPSGAGKSTTQKILIKLLDDYQGRIIFDGKDLTHYNSDFYERIGVGFELPNHFSKLTAHENLQFFAGLYDHPTRDIDQLLLEVGLEESKHVKVSNFSKGMKMRLNFIRALLNNPEVLFLDEPTSGLDPVNAKIIKDMILREKEQGKTIFVTTHNMQAADDLCDRVAFIVDGKLEEMDSPKELKLKHGKKAIRIEYFQNNQLDVQEFSLEQLGQNQAFLDLIQTNEIRTIHSLETTLEEVFIQVTGRRLV